MSMLVVTCRCGQRMKASPELMGRAVKCVKCGVALTLTPENTEPFPRSDSAPASPAPSSGLPGMRVGELLIKDKLITPEQLEEALSVQQEQGGKTFEILLSLGHLDRPTLHEFLSRQSGVAAINLKNYHIPRDLVELLPKHLAKVNLVVPIDRLGSLLTVGMACPLDQATIDEVQSITGLKVKPMLCTFDDVEEAIRRYYPTDPDEEEAESAPPGEVEEPGHAPSQPEASAPEELPQGLSAAETAEALSQLEILPTLADTVERVRQAIEGHAASVKKLAEIVVEDPPVAANLLNVANVAAYGMPRQVGDVAVAAALLGVDGICELVIASKSAAAGLGISPSDAKELAEEARFCAEAARRLAAACNAELEERARTAGLLHNLGRIALKAALPDMATGNGGPAKGSAAAERAAFGMSQAEAGAWIGEEWGFPGDIVEALRCQDDLDCVFEQPDLAPIVALAAFLTRARQAVMDSGEDALEPCAGLLAGLGLDGGSVTRIIEDARAHG